MEENKLKEVKLVLGYNYYIVNSILPTIVNYPYNSIYFNYMDTKDFYKTYYRLYTRYRNNQEQELISCIYHQNMSDNCCLDTFCYIEKNIKEFFKYMINNSSYVIISKTKDSDKIYFFKEQRELNEYIQKHDIKDKIFQDYCTIELSDKLLERIKNEQHSC